MEYLKIFDACPTCNRTDAGHETVVVSEENDVSLQHFTYHSCHHQFLALIAMSPQGVSAIAARTDLTGEDAVTFQTVDTVSEDDIFDFHNNTVWYTRLLPKSAKRR